MLTQVTRPGRASQTTPERHGAMQVLRAGRVWAKGPVYGDWGTRHVSVPSSHSRISAEHLSARIWRLHIISAFVCAYRCREAGLAVHKHCMGRHPFPAGFDIRDLGTPLLVKAAKHCSYYYTFVTTLVFPTSLDTSFIRVPRFPVVPVRLPEQMARKNRGIRHGCASRPLHCLGMAR